jgi:hypothetical protein
MRSTTKRTNNPGFTERGKFIVRQQQKVVLTSLTHVIKWSDQVKWLSSADHIAVIPNPVVAKITRISHCWRYWAGSVHMELGVQKGRAFTSREPDQSGDHFEERRENFVDRCVSNFHSIDRLVSKTYESWYGIWLSKGRKIAPSGVRIPASGIWINSVRC